MPGYESGILLGIALSLLLVGGFGSVLHVRWLGLILAVIVGVAHALTGGRPAAIPGLSAPRGSASPSPGLVPQDRREASGCAAPSRMLSDAIRGPAHPAGCSWGTQWSPAPLRPLPAAETVIRNQGQEFARSCGAATGRFAQSYPRLTPVTGTGGGGADSGFAAGGPVCVTTGCDGPADARSGRPGGGGRAGGRSDQPAGVSRSGVVARVPPSVAVPARGRGERRVPVGETICVLACLLFWIGTGLGWTLTSTWSVRAHRMLLAGFLGVVLAAFGRCFGFRVHLVEPMTYPEDLLAVHGDTPLIVLALNRPGFGGGSQSMKDESYVCTEEVQRRAA